MKFLFDSNDIWVSFTSEKRCRDFIGPHRSEEGSEVEVREWKKECSYRIWRKRRNVCLHTLKRRLEESVNKARHVMCPHGKFNETEWLSLRRATFVAHSIFLTQTCSNTLAWKRGWCWSRSVELVRSENLFLSPPPPPLSPLQSLLLHTRCSSSRTKRSGLWASIRYVTFVAMKFPAGILVLFTSRSFPYFLPSSTIICY